jgi:catechol 2,3-dioxygenase-like lactoylglutathione lyase family enzyme
MTSNSGAPPAVNRLLESALYVDDLDRSQRFYGTLFGFETTLRDDRMCAMALPGRQVLLLFRRGGSGGPNTSPVGTIPSHDAVGAQHLCFAIDHPAVTRWESYLAASGIAIEQRLDWPQGATSLYFRDPDGHSLEVGTPRLWPNDPGP